MSGRRTILLGCTAALILAAVGWFVFRDSRSPSELPDLAPPSLGEPDTVRTPVATVPQEGAPAPSPEPARGAADPSGIGLDAGPIDEFTVDGLREDEEQARPRTSAVGRVIDGKGEPVAGARVLGSLKETCAGAALDAPANQEFVRAAETDAGGEFRLVNLDTGPLRVEVHAPGFAPLVAREFNLPAGEKTDLGPLQLARGVVLAGRVVDEDRRPVRALISRVSAPLLGPVHKLGLLAASPLGASDEDGRFELPCVAPGRLNLLVRSADCPEAIFEVEAAADVERIADLELVLFAGAEISGRIPEYDHATMEGLSVIASPDDESSLFSESRPPGANWTWLAGLQEARVDRFGDFTVRALAPGRSYVLQARREPGIQAARDPDLPDPWAPSTVAPAGAVDVEVAYLPGCRIDFEVVDSTSGAKIERLRVQMGGVWPTEALSEGARGSSDGASAARSFFPGGRVSLVDLRATRLESAVDPSDPPPQTGMCSLTIEAPGFDSAVLEGLRLEPGSRLELGTVGLRPVPILEVRVLDARDNSPLAGARVELCADHPERVTGRIRSLALSGQNGFARLTSLSTVAATLSVSCPGYAPSRVRAPSEIRFGAPPLEVALSIQARVAVSVRDSRAAAAPSVLVSMTRHETPDGLQWSRTAVTDAAGLAVFNDVPSGVFDLAALSRNGIATETPAGSARPSATTLVVQAGDELAVNLEILALSSLSGTIWLGREPLARAQISVEAGPRAFRDLGTNMSRFSTPPRFYTDSQGSFERVDLMPGVYSLLIEQSSRHVRTLRVVRVEPSPTDVIIDIDDTAITGTVFDKRGDPVVGATVQLFADRPGRRADIRPVVGEFLVPFEDYRRPVGETTTNALGVYRMACVPPGIPLELFFSSGRKAASIPRINAPQGTTLERIDSVLPDVGSLEIVLTAPVAPSGLHYGVRIVGFEQPEGLAMFGAVFDEERRVRFDDLPPGRWVVMVFTLNAGEQVVDQRQAQAVHVKSGQTTEFSVGW